MLTVISSPDRRAYAMAQRPSSVNVFLQTISSQDPLGQIQSKLVGNMLGGWRFRFIQIKGMAPFGAQ